MIDKSVRILIVDNDEPLRWLLAKCLSCYYTCVTAGSVDEATEILATTDFDLVIAEIRMSGASGLELCQFANRACPGTAVLIMSTAADVVRGLQSFTNGACDYILKPIDLSLMLDSVERVLRRQATLSVVRSALTNPDRTQRIGSSESNRSDARSPR
ncbi:MAG TPA: response regulator, partial [Blastocatellia bacterium]|nr:response regulator [Blastocatellia bacterium]